MIVDSKKHFSTPSLACGTPLPHPRTPHHNHLPPGHRPHTRCPADDYLADDGMSGRILLLLPGSSLHYLDSCSLHPIAVSTPCACGGESTKTRIASVPSHSSKQSTWVMQKPTHLRGSSPYRRCTSGVSDEPWTKTKS